MPYDGDVLGDLKASLVNLSYALIIHRPVQFVNSANQAVRISSAGLLGV